MRRLLIIAILLSSVSVFAANPGSRVKQLKLGTIMYGSADMMTNTTRRQWIADRYSLVVGQGPWGGTSQLTAVTDLKGYNPYLRINSYVVYAPFARTNSSYTEDTSTIRAWAGSDARMDSMLITAGPLASDSVSARTRDFGATQNFVVAHTGERISYLYFNDINGYRLAFDYRYPRLGNFYAHWWMNDFTSSLSVLDGFFVDEESYQSLTGVATSGIETPHWPLRNNTSTIWEYGADTWRRIKYPWSASLTFTQIHDSLLPLRLRNLRIASESLQVNGLVCMNNPAISVSVTLRGATVPPLTLGLLRGTPSLPHIGV